jgi:3-hydroxybutyryl-CoA dehydrogenase
MTNRICVCGAGTMGIGIAQVAAQNGFTAVLYDLSEDLIAKAKTTLENSLIKLVDKSRISDKEKADIHQGIHFSSDIRDCKAEVIIEAIAEKMEAKIGLFERLVQINTPQTVFATNTSSLSVTRISRAIRNPERVIGMHFFNPAPVMALVEVVCTPDTSADTIQTIIELAKQFGKTPVICQDSPGFIVNHVARPFYIEALKLMEAGISEIETIDKLIESSGFRMGPFRLMDLIGNDVNYEVSCSIYEAMGRPARLKPSRVQHKLVQNHELGKKTGKGFYNYP